MSFQWRTLILLGLAVHCAMAWATPIHDSELSDTQLQIEQLLNTPDLEIQGDRVFMQNLMREVYVTNAFEPLWTNAERIAELRTLLLESASHGLQPDDYHLQLIDQLLSQTQSSAGPGSRAGLDLLLTDGLMLYAYHRRLGKIKAQDIDPDINFKREALSEYSSPQAVRKAISSDNLAGLIEKIAPSAAYYEMLQRQLLRYRMLAAQGGWSQVPPGSTLRAMDRDVRVTALRERLQIEGSLATAESADPEYFDTELEQAVRDFQQLHGLQRDGVVGKQTMSVMNMPVSARVDQLRLSLERLRWVSQEVSDTFVVVNIAGFRLSYVRQREVIWSTRVMVGTPYRKTPIFQGDITYIEFNPTWTIPPTILREDTLPKIKQDPTYLVSRNISVIDSSGQKLDPASIDWTAYRRTIPYTLRQEAGPNNTLGKMKFIFPNKHMVYLHDTPHQSLFNHPDRAFSSGCIRVENALTLAEMILEDSSDFTLDGLPAILASSKTRRVVLAKPMPILILYLTAALDEAGNARFYRDVYQRDDAELRALNGPVLVNLPIAKGDGAH